jgi:hypothetical protein
MAKVGLWLLLVAAVGIAAAAILNLITVLGSAIAGRTVVELPASGIAAATPSGASILGPKVLEAGAGNSIQLVVKDVPGDALVLNATASVMGTLTAVVVCGAVVLLCWRLLRAEPFARSLPRTMAYTGGLLVLIGVVCPVLQGLAKLSIVNSLDSVVTVDSPINKGNFDFYVASSFNLLPIVLGVALLLLAAVFAKGAQLQRDTEGLV